MINLKVNIKFVFFKKVGDEHVTRTKRLYITIHPESHSDFTEHMKTLKFLDESTSHSQEKKWLYNNWDPGGLLFVHCVKLFISR